MTARLAPPLRAAPISPQGEPQHSPAAARGLLVYVILLFALPSTLTISGLGSYGRPSLIWGLLLLAWWCIWHLQNGQPAEWRPGDPVGVGLLILAAIILIGFAVAMMRGQPSDQFSPALSALLRLASWSGVVLVALEGLTNIQQVRRLVRFMVFIASGLALLGLAQTVTGRSLLAWAQHLPGIVIDTSDTVVAREGFTRSAGLAIHPLEHLTMLVGMLPLAIGLGGTAGFRRRSGLRDVAWWIPAGLITLSCLVSVSRSAMLGLTVGVLVSLPLLGRAQRLVVLLLGAFGAIAVAFAMPGIAGTVVQLFASGSSDPSTKSRTDALARVPEFMSSSPLLGAGFGTFLPRYYIFDNQWVLLLVETGLLGTAAFAALLLSGVWSANRAGRSFEEPMDKPVAVAVAGSLIALGVSYATFDALSFPMSAGLLFLGLGFAAALLRIARARVAVTDRSPDGESPATGPGTQQDGGMAVEHGVQREPGR